MTKLPAFQFYPADWRKDPGVQSLAYHDRGVWFEILCLMHESEQRGKLLLNGKAMPDEVLARLLGLDKQILTRTLATLIEYGVAERDERDALTNRRMMRDEHIRQIRIEAGKKGGNPALLNQTSNQNPTTQVKQKSTPSSSSSTTEEKKEEKEGRQATSPAKSIRPRDSRQEHPAIKAFLTVTGKWPLKDLWDALIEAVGDNPDEVLLKRCWIAWRGKGFSPTNYAWVLEWYQAGGPDKAGNNGINKQLSKSNIGALQKSSDYFEQKYGTGDDAR